MEVNLLPLVPGVDLPIAAPAVARSDIPPGYGVQEQCLPFTAATALGFLIKSPITFGYCPPVETPAGVHSFRSPLDARAQRQSDGNTDQRQFYVKDDPGCRFLRNAFVVDSIETSRQKMTPVVPGLSFFDREDQRDLFKIHLPYIWHTPPEVDTLFLPAINRPNQALEVLIGLVETDWYANSVNMVCRVPQAEESIHIVAGDIIAQAIFISRSHRRPSLKILADHARLTRDLKSEMLEWYKSHDQDRSAYKKIARSQHGRVTKDKS